MTPRDGGNPIAPEDLRVPDEEEFASAASDPVGAQALEMMRRRPTTAADVAAATGEPLDEVSRRLDDLRRSGLIVIVGSSDADGRSESLYEGPFVPFLDKEEWSELDDAARNFQLRQIIRLLMTDIEEAMKEGTLEAWPDFHLCRMPFLMDDQGWDEVRSVYDAALLRAVRIRKDAEERLREGGERGKRGTLGQALFELPDAD